MPAKPTDAGRGKGLELWACPKHLLIRRGMPGHCIFRENRTAGECGLPLVRFIPAASAPDPAEVEEVCKRLEGYFAYLIVHGFNVTNDRLAIEKVRGRKT